MFIRIVSIFIICVCALSNVHAKVASKQLPFTFYVNIPVTAQGVELSIGAQYRIPRDVEGPMPAVVIFHNSAGIDSTGKFYAKALNNAGIATLEVDLWGGRDLLGGSENRPALPLETLPDAYAALDFLANKPEIDANKIGIMGFSWGGVLSLLTATEQYNQVSGTQNRYAGHIAHYPVCWGFNVIPGFEFGNLSGAPVLIQAAGLDGYDVFPETCPNMVAAIPEADQALVDVRVYQNALHAWDRLEPEWIVNDPFSNLGQGGLVTLSPNKKIAKKSRRKVVKFFKELFETPE